MVHGCKAAHVGNSFVRDVGIDGGNGCRSIIVAVACIALIGAAALLVFPLVLRRGVGLKLGGRYSGDSTITR